MAKQYKITGSALKQYLVEGAGWCIASDMITVDGMPVGFMYREQPTKPTDSGWRFLSGAESDSYVADKANLDTYLVNTIVNYDEAILPLLLSPHGSAFKRGADGRFVPTAMP